MADFEVVMGGNGWPIVLPLPTWFVVLVTGETNRVSREAGVKDHNFQGFL